MERLLALKKELQSNLEVLKQEHEDLKTTNEEYATEIKNLLSKIGERDKELESMKGAKADYDTLFHKYQNLERIHSLLRENAEKFQEENQDLHEEVFKLQEEVTKLGHEIEVAHKQADMLDMVPRDTYEELLKEVNELKDRRNSNQVHLDEINIDDNAKGVIETLKRDINELKHKLAQKESTCHENVDNKVIKPEKVMQLYNKYVNFELPIDYVGEIPSAGDNIVLFKLESVFKTVHSFKKEIDVLDHKLSEKNLNANHLQTQIDDLTTENDFLTTDIQHLERDLSEMKKNNDFLISEIAALKNTSKLEPIIETHEDNLAKLETELADSNKMNKLFESEIKRVLKELDEVRTEKISLRNSLNDIKQKYSTMLDEFEMLRNQSSAVADLEHTVNTKDQEKLKRTTDEIDDLKKRLNSTHSKNEQLSIDIHILENDKVLLTKKVDDLQVALDEKCYAHKELENLKSALDHKLQDFEIKLDEVIKHKQDVESDKDSLQEKVTLLQEQLSTVSTASTKVENATTENSLMAEKIHEMSVANETLSDTIKTLKEAIADLQRKEQELLTENSNLKKDMKTEKEIKALEVVIEELKSKAIRQELLSNEHVTSLKAEVEKLTERKLQLEAELSSTDRKILHLEEEFDKLVSDLNEKDTLIDGLNNTVQHNNITIQQLKENVADLEKSVTVKNDEINVLKDLASKSNQSEEELNKLHNEKEDLTKQVYSLTDEINAKNNEISTLSGRLEELEKSRDEYKRAIVDKEKEIKELSQSIVELTDKIKTTDNITHHNDLATVIQNKEAIEADVAELKDYITSKENYIEELKESYASVEKMAAEYKTIIDNAMSEKAELINLINLKHNESIQYHNEIQRLNQVILEHNDEYKKVIEERDNLIKSYATNCTNCENLRVTLKEKDGIIVSLNQNIVEFQKAKSELQAANESVKNLKERCENLEKNLTVQMERVKKLTAENAQVNN